MPDLSTRYLGLDLRTPLVASASPLSSTVAGIEELAANGAGAIVLPSLFGEQVERERLVDERIWWNSLESVAVEARYDADLDGYNAGPGPYLLLVQRARTHVDVPIVASLNCGERTMWPEYASMVEQAGAQAIELNAHVLAVDPEVGAEEVERRYVDLVAAVRAAVTIPIAVKLVSSISALPNLARRLGEAGADGLVLFNRLHTPDVDLETLAVRPRLSLSDPAELGTVLRWIGVLHGRVSLDLAASTGIHTGDDAVKALLAGADVAMMTSALLRHGPGHLATVEARLVAFMVEHRLGSVADLRGSASLGNADDVGALDRFGYLAALVGHPLA